MANLQLKIKTTKEEVIEIETPCFFKDQIGMEYIGVFEPSEVFRVLKLTDYACITAGTIVSYHEKVIEAYQNWQPIGIEEFRLVHDQVIKLLSLPKMQITTADLQKEVPYGY